VSLDQLFDQTLRLKQLLERLPFKHVVAADFEFHFGGHDTLEAAGRSGERPRPVCGCFEELRTGERWQLFEDFGSEPPFPTDNYCLVAYYASAELGNFRAVKWPQPKYILDLFTEFRAFTNGYYLEHGSGLLGALIHFGLDALSADEKDEMRLRILRGPPWLPGEPEAILAYCASDIAALKSLLSKLLPRLNLPAALLRGRYMKAAAAMEWNGTPVDTATLALLRQHWTGIQEDLIAVIDRDYGVFEGRTFKAERWAHFLQSHDIPWPVHESGRLDLSADTFRQQSRAYPIVAPIRELRSALSDLRLNDLAVGADGRNRTILSAFRARTGRNQPSNTRFIFGPSTWLRSLIKPQPGYGVAYEDYEQQEFGIAAAFSGDVAMQEAYRSGDPYLAFAKQARAVPVDATKETHGPQRELFKQCTLAVGYGMSAEGLARRIGQPLIVGRDLLRAHHEAFPRFWRWSDAAVDHGVLTGLLQTVFAWPLYVGAGFNPRALRNFPMQSNGSEMLRLACCLATEAGIEVCAPVHDAVLIAAPLERLDHDVERMRYFMAQASRVVLGGFELRTEAKLLRHPDRYSDPRGKVMWDRVMQLIAAREAREVA
jgi:DNA polymerase-1